MIKQEEGPYNDYDRNLLKIDYYLSEDLITFNRKVETLSTALSLTGGLLGIIAQLVTFLIGWF